MLRLRTLVRHYEIRYPRAFTSPMLQGHAAAMLPAVAEEEMAVVAPDGKGAAGSRPASPLALPALPLIMQNDEMRRLARLGLAVNPLLGNEKYAPPVSGGTMADSEVRRLRELLSFVVSGELPANPSLEVLDLQQASELQYEYREANAAVAIYTADGDSLRAVDNPQHMAAAGLQPGSPPRSAQSADGLSALVEQMAFDDSTAEGRPLSQRRNLSPPHPHTLVLSPEPTACHHHHLPPPPPPAPPPPPSITAPKRARSASASDLLPPSHASQSYRRHRGLRRVELSCWRGGWRSGARSFVAASPCSGLTSTRRRWRS